MRALTLTPDDYVQLRRAFAGGKTHANALYVGEIVKNVHSKDFTSSYPYVMLSEKFPMSKPVLRTLHSDDEFRNYLNNYCCVFDIEIWGLEPVYFFENYISKSHCKELQEPIINNGRVVFAKHLRMTVTEQDFFIIEQYYKWEQLAVYNFRTMNKAYLPTSFVTAILDLYEKKTTLKDVEGMELEYLLSKEKLNSMYGMCVTDIAREKIEYTPIDWRAEKPVLEEAIEKNNKSIKRFLYYAWGVWVTAYARFNLFTAITELKDDYVYCDTDSVKYINAEKHERYFKLYNDAVVYKLNIAMKFHGIDPERTRPKNKYGVIKQIGVWDDEGTYTRFKTLGAKRYLTEKDCKLKLTVSGLNKKDAIEYMQKTYGDKVFEAFEDNLYIPKGSTGKMTHTYIDEEQEGELVDYLGNVAHYHEKSSIHLGDADYSLSLNEFFVRYILSIKDIEVPNE